MKDRICPDWRTCKHKCINHKQPHALNHECDMRCEFDASGCIQIPEMWLDKGDTSKLNEKPISDYYCSQICLAPWGCDSCPIFLEDKRYTDRLQSPETEVEAETIRIIHERNAKGRETYGQGLEHSDPKWDWIDMAIEEAADMLKYLIAQKLRMRDESK